MYTVNGIKVQFSVQLLPFDMKWLSTVAGELNNAAYYFSTFGNKIVLNGSLGEDKSCTWQTWDDNERLSIAQKVA